MTWWSWSGWRNRSQRGPQLEPTSRVEGPRGLTPLPDRATKTTCPICGGDKRMLCSRCMKKPQPRTPGLKGGW